MSRSWWIVGSIGVVILATIGFAVLFPAAQSDLLSDDVYYHLIVARDMIAEGTLFPRFDDWLLAPEPRPHIYPPLFHWALAGTSLLTGLGLDQVALAFQVTLFPLVSFSLVALAAKSLPPRAAFLAVMVFTTTFPLAARTHLAIPEALELGLIALALLTYLERREWLCGAILLVMLLNHTGSPVLFAGALLAHQAYVRVRGDDEARRRLAPILIVALPGLALQGYWGFVNLLTEQVDADNLRPSLPWVLRNYLNPWTGISSILLPIALSLWAWFKGLRHLVVPLCLILVLAYAVILVTYSARFPSYALIPLGLTAGLALHEALGKTPSLGAVGALTAVMVLNGPASFWYYPYSYDYLRPSAEQETVLRSADQAAPRGQPVCGRTLYDGYRVTWLTGRQTTLYELGCGTATLLYSRRPLPDSPGWEPVTSRGGHSLYARSSPRSDPGSEHGPAQVEIPSLQESHR